MGISLDIQELDNRSRDSRRDYSKEEWAEAPPARTTEKGVVEFQSSISKNGVKIFLNERYADRNVDLMIGNDYLMTVKVGYGGIIKVKKSNKISKMVIAAIQEGKLTIRG